MYQPGEVVLFSTGSESILKCNVGIVIGTQDQKYAVLNRNITNGSVYVLEEKYIDSLDNLDKVRQDIIDYYSPKIEELKSKLRTVTSEEKVQERVAKYNDIKSRILINCERLIASTDDDEFENRLKEIGNLKKQLHSLDLECGDIIRKENGGIKFEIKKINLAMTGNLSRISDEYIAKASKF